MIHGPKVCPGYKRLNLVHGLCSYPCPNCLRCPPVGVETFTPSFLNLHPAGLPLAFHCLPSFLRNRPSVASLWDTLAYGLLPTVVLYRVQKTQLTPDQFTASSYSAIHVLVRLRTLSPSQDTSRPLSCPITLLCPLLLNCPRPV
jgi:hypothetical protein